VRTEGDRGAIGSATNVQVRGLRSGDLWTVLALGRRVFPTDPWTTDSAGGWLARLTDGGRAPFSAWLAGIFRLARVNEAANLARLTCAVAFGRPSSFSCFVAEADKTVIGYAAVNSTGAGIGAISVIAVRPEHEGQGVGKALLTQLAATAAAHGCQSVTLYVRADNAHARTFYERNDFIEAGRLAGYYQPSATDAIVMRRDLPGGSSHP